MTAQSSQSWLQANQRYLMAELAVIRKHLDHCRAHERGEDVSGDEVGMHAARNAVEQAKRALERPAPIDVLCDVFGLSSFERTIVLLCAGIELDKDLASVCADIHGERVATFALTLMVFPDAAWGPLLPDAPLRYWHIIELGPGNTLATRRLRIDEVILHFLLGLRSVDERLLGTFSQVPKQGVLTPSQETSVARVIELWSGNKGTPTISLCSSVATAMRAVAARACAQVGFHLYSVDAKDLPDAALDQVTAARLWQRHLALFGSALLIEITSDASRHKAMAFAERVRGPVLMAAADPVRLRNRTVVRVDVAKPLLAEQRALWTQALGDRASRLGDSIDAVAGHFHFSAADIAAVAANVHARSPHGSEEMLWKACRSQARPKFEALAQHIVSRATWDDLVLAERHKQMLREIAVHVHHKNRVYESWGFAGKSSRGLGISALFAGPSGTGKTTAAEILARELDLDLYRIDLSAVVSKYIGETEKNLGQVFDAAENGGVILLFDEADALFGKRSDVKDSHDRYANMEVSYLLQRMEAYRGLAILTSNLRDALDTAFMRRIRFIIEFPFPSPEDRAAIWARMFPADAPTQGLDVSKLARLNVSGGSIRNIALGGAFLAAEEGAPIQMKHLQRAARSELAKLSRPVPERDFKDWV